MKFGASRSQLYDARRRHEETLVEPLDQLVSHVLRAVDQLGAVFADVRQSVAFEE